MKPNNSRDRDGKALVNHILKLANDIFRAVKLSIPPQWLASDMTVAQLRVLLFLHTEGASRMGYMASAIGTTLSTTTGTVDMLVKKELVVRGADPEDRRLVICELSPQGQKIINLIWASGQQQVESLLDGLSEEELQKADVVAEILLRNVTSGANPA
jgi:DNA-binding MarR family transcriptional regulator